MTIKNIKKLSKLFKSSKIQNVQKHVQKAFSSKAFQKLKFSAPPNFCNINLNELFVNTFSYCAFFNSNNYTSSVILNSY